MGPLILYDFISETDALAIRYIADNSAGMTELRININSPGGNVQSGFVIIDALRELQAKGIRVVARIDGIAASMASVIAMAADEIWMAGNGEMMIHMPWGRVEGTSKQLRIQADRLEQREKQIAEMYAARSGRSMEEILSLMDEEKWLTPEQALSLKLIDKIIEPQLRRSEQVQASGKLPATELHKAFNPISNTMTPEQIKALQDENAQLKATNDTLKASVDKLTQEMNTLKQESQKARAEQLVAQAIQEGKISKDQEKQTLDLAISAYDTTKAFIDAMPKAGPEASLHDQLNQGTGSFTIPADRASWTHRDWERKDPKGLAKMKASAPKAYAALIEAEYGK